MQLRLNTPLMCCWGQSPFASWLLSRHCAPLHSPRAQQAHADHIQVAHGLSGQEHVSAAASDCCTRASSRAGIRWQAAPQRTITPIYTGLTGLFSIWQRWLPDSRDVGAGIACVRTAAE